MKETRVSWVSKIRGPFYFAPRKGLKWFSPWWSL